MRPDERHLQRDMDLLGVRGPSWVVDVRLVPIGKIRAEEQQDAVKGKQDAAKHLAG